MKEYLNNLYQTNPVLYFILFIFIPITLINTWLLSPTSISGRITCYSNGTIVYDNYGDEIYVGDKNYYIDNTFIKFDDCIIKINDLRPYDFKPVGIE